MSKETQIKVEGNLPNPTITIISEALEARRSILERASLVLEINSVTDLDEAAASLLEVKTLADSVEKSRKEVKAPVLDVGRNIDSTAKKFLEPLTKEQKRLSILVGSYQEAERRKAEQARAEEAARQAEAMAEMKRKEAEALAAGDEAAADAARAEAANTIAESQLASANAAGAQLDGISTVTRFQFEVTDVEALYKAAPHLCRIEPNTTMLRAHIKDTKGKALPGVRIWQEAGTVVRKQAAVKVEEYDY